MNEFWIFVIVIVVCILLLFLFYYFRPFDYVWNVLTGKVKASTIIYGKSINNT